MQESPYPKNESPQRNVKNFLDYIKLIWTCFYMFGHSQVEIVDLYPTKTHAIHILCDHNTNPKRHKQKLNLMNEKRCDKGKGFFQVVITKLKALSCQMWSYEPQPFFQRTSVCKCRFTKYDHWHSQPEHVLHQFSDMAQLHTRYSG